MRTTKSKISQIMKYGNDRIKYVWKAVKFYLILFAPRLARLSHLPKLCDCLVQQLLGLKVKGYFDYYGTGTGLFYCKYQRKYL